MTDQTPAIPKGWKMTTLGEMLGIKNGKSRPDDGETYPVYGGNGVLGYSDEYNIDEKIIIVGRVGAYCGSIFLENEKFWLSDNALGVLPKENSNIDFLYYLLKKTNLNKQAIGGAQPLLTQGVINQIEVLVPEDKEEQRAIAAVLASLDDKIELLREQNKVLDATAQAVFKEWFVIFNFPDATGKMIDSELGEIPEGWRVDSLSKIAVFLNGLALQKFPPESTTEYLPVIKIRELSAGVSAQTDRASARLDKKYIVEDGDVLFSWSGSLVVDIWKYGKGALNQHLFKVTSEDFPKWFYFHWTKEHLASFQQTAIAKAVTMGHIQRHHLDDALVVIPDEKFLKIADKVFAPMLDKFINNNSQIQALSILRDALLSKLMKGEIRVAGV